MFKCFCAAFFIAVIILFGFHEAEINDLAKQSKDVAQAQADLAQFVADLTDHVVKSEEETQNEFNDAVYQNFNDIRKKQNLIYANVTQIKNSLRKAYAKV